MEDTKIKTRISIGIKEQGDIDFIHDIHAIKNLSNEYIDGFNDRHFFDIGSIIEYKGCIYKIVNIRTLSYESQCGKDFVDKDGIIRHEYNYEVSYFVKQTHK